MDEDAMRLVYRKWFNRYASCHPGRPLSRAELEDVAVAAMNSVVNNAASPSPPDEAEGHQYVAWLRDQGVHSEEAGAPEKEWCAKLNAIANFIERRLATGARG